MSGLEKIIGQIDAQAKADAAELLRCAQADAEELRSQAQASCQAELAQIQERSTRDIAACRARAASAVEQQRRMALLQTKQEIIGQMLQSALHTLQAEPADAYFTAVEKLVGRFARPQAGQIVFSQQDLDRMPQDFAARPRQGRSLAAALSSSTAALKKTARSRRCLKPGKRNCRTWCISSCSHKGDRKGVFHV